MNAITQLEKMHRNIGKAIEILRGTDLDTTKDKTGARKRGRPPGSMNRYREPDAAQLAAATRIIRKRQVHASR